jgi:hypothetical protein
MWLSMGKESQKDRVLVIAAKAAIQSFLKQGALTGFLVQSGKLNTF